MTFSEWFANEQFCKGNFFFHKCISLTMITRLIVGKYSFVGDFLPKFQSSLFWCKEFKSVANCDVGVSDMWPTHVGSFTPLGYEIF